jgi:hypothetical protein
MSASEIIALAAVTVAGISALVTGVSVWTGHLQANRRLDHEKDLQVKRLDHERAEAVRTKAAVALTQTLEVYVASQPDLVEAMSEEDFREWAGELDQTSQVLHQVSALGWSTDVRQSALVVARKLLGVAHGAWVFAGLAILADDPASVNPDELRRARTSLEDAAEELGEALRAYQLAISE